MCPQNETESSKEEEERMARDASSANGTPPSDKEKSLIIEFRTRVKDVLENEEQKADFYLLKWIRARDENLDKAEQMLRNHLKWRREHDMDFCLTKTIDPFIKENYRGPYFFAKDKQGRPIGEVHVGSWDVRKAMDAGKEEEFHAFVNFFFENVLQVIRNAGQLTENWPHTQFIYFVDWEGYSYAQLIHWKAVQGLLKFASQYEAHYPEVAYKVYFVNCPSIMPLFMALLKPLLAKKTYEKIHLFGSKKEEWEPALRDVAQDPDTLWQRFGGKRVQPEDNN